MADLLYFFGVVKVPRTMFYVLIALIVSQSVFLCRAKKGR